MANIGHAMRIYVLPLESIIIVELKRELCLLIYMISDFYNPFFNKREKNNCSTSDPISTRPLPVTLGIFPMLMFIGFPWFINYEPILESVFDQVKLYLIVCPLLLLLIVHWFSNNESSWFSYLVPLPAETDRAGVGRGTPWGVGFVVVLLLFLISYQSYFKERWFPHLTKYK
ncbi:hypothetical protein Ddye_031960 [Dipteronia dyeriana]|uniref:Uncharacterized protein n=1 Tax=Dipteronia dyeriana TaxID=168575 RepID=A0AAD9TJU6_9ROSI|nr:hypothetical protein Ddye_031960 [Dipteronia dyeriana]